MGAAAGQRVWRVLIVDDEDNLNWSLVNSLRKDSYAADGAMTGDDALRLPSQRDAQPVRGGHPGAVWRGAATREERRETALARGLGESASPSLHVVGRLHAGTIPDALGNILSGQRL